MTYDFPDAKGPYGGQFIAKTLMAPLRELPDAYARLKDDPAFLADLDRDLTHYVGRPSPLYLAERLTKAWGGTRIIAETGAGQHGVASATIAARLGVAFLMVNFQRAATAQDQRHINSDKWAPASEANVTPRPVPKAARWDS